LVRRCPVLEEIVSREGFLTVADRVEAETSKTAASRWQWIYPVLIIIGMILVLASLLYLTQGPSTGSVPDASLVL
jgi:hypothetical protein